VIFVDFVSKQTQVNLIVIFIDLRIHVLTLSNLKSNHSLSRFFKSLKAKGYDFLTLIATKPACTAVINPKTHQKNTVFSSYTEQTQIALWSSYVKL